MRAPTLASKLILSLLKLTDLPVNVTLGNAPNLVSQPASADFIINLHNSLYPGMGIYQHRQHLLAGKLLV